MAHSKFVEKLIFTILIKKQDRAKYESLEYQKF